MEVFVVGVGEVLVSQSFFFPIGMEWSLDGIHHKDIFFWNLTYLCSEVELGRKTSEIIGQLKLALTARP